MRESEMFEHVAYTMGIDVKKVIAYSNFHWQQAKVDLNNPTFDVLEIPFLGAFTMTFAKMRSTLKYELKALKRLKKKVEKDPTNSRLIKQFEAQKEYFKNLWKLKQELYDEEFVCRKTRNGKKRNGQSS